MLFLTASAHWGSRRTDLVAMVPTTFPRPDVIVTLTGMLEIAAAVGLLFDRTAQWAGTGAALLFVPMFVANIHAARERLSIRDTPVTPLPIRTAMQISISQSRSRRRGEMPAGRCENRGWPLGT
jgi:uncharacterized membrane protein